MSQAAARLFPLFADLRGRRVVVVGGGAVARRKVEALIGAGAQVVVGAPRIRARGRGRQAPGWAEGRQFVRVWPRRREAGSAAHRGIDYEIVPDITAAVACDAYAGIPLTHRQHAQSLRLGTAKDDLDTLDWASLAREQQTLAIYMGVARLDRVRDRLLAQGLAASKPFALVANGSRPEQRVVTGTLADLPALGRLHEGRAPALLVVGAVAAFAETLHWFGPEPVTNTPLTDAAAASLSLAAAA